MQLLTKADKPVLLMFDEVQHLASNIDFTDLIASLRTFLDSNKNKVKAVFTGSSQDGLNQIFRSHKAAFYNSASLMQFPDMEESFIVHLHQCFLERSGRELNIPELNQAYIKYHHSPFHIVTLLQTMLLQGIYDIDKALLYYEQTMNPNQEYQQVWNSLKGIDQKVLHCIQEEKNLYSDQTYHFLADELGIDSVGQGLVQASLKRLRSQGIIINPERGIWRVESTGLSAFIDGI